MSRLGASFGVPEFYLRKIRGAGAKAEESLAHALRAGATIASGSDLLGPMQIYRAKELELQARVMGPLGAIVAATKTNAELIGRDKDLGTLKAGKPADLILVDGDPLKDITMLQQCQEKIVLIMQGGRMHKNFSEKPTPQRKEEMTMKCFLLPNGFGRVVFPWLMCLLLIVALGGQADGADRRKTLVVVSVRETVTLDPQVSLDGQSPLVWRGVYEPLLGLKGDSLEIIPGLAEKWDVADDGKTYTFYLQKGVKFHDGSPFTAESVKFTLERSRALKKAGSYVLDPVQEIKVLDDHTVRIILNNPVRSFLSAMAGMYSPSWALKPQWVKEHEIMIEKEGQKTGDWGEKYLYDHMLGTGPYKFVRWDHGQQIILERFEDYWKGWEDRHFDRIIIKYIQEPATANLMLQRGEADIAIGLTDQMKNDLEKMSAQGVAVYRHPSLETYYIGLNCKKGPTADVRVRKAIAHAFPYPKYVKENLQGNAKQMIGFIPSTFPGYNPEIPVYPYDLDQARKLLTEAGYPNGGFTIKYVWETGYEWKRPVAEVLQQNLKQLGIQMTIQELNNAAFNALLSNPDSAEHAYGVVWWPFVDSPVDYFWSMCHKDAQAAGGWNWVYYDNPEVNRRIDSIESILDDREWYANVTRLQQILYEEVPYLCLYEADYRIPHRQNLHGFYYNGLYTDTLPFYEMWKE
ncbi:MAG: amidohydrolase family protein [Desulfobacterales bacterium]|nr:MAG: amidohydrolase family protein [Desulfobacterales bacterium]